MFNLASYLLGYGDSSTNPEPEVPGPESEEEEIRLKISEEEDEWLMVDALSGRSRRSSTTSLPCLTMEESWFVTPPPCFTSTGPVLVETSPLENLLIEHPSMSVYHHRGIAQPSRETIPPPRTRSLSPARANPPPPAPRRNRVPLQLNQVQNMQAQAFAAQKKEKLKDSIVLKAKQMERNNKVKETNKRNKKQRRCDKQKNHSGANNNRKCY